MSSAQTPAPPRSAAPPPKAADAPAGASSGGAKSALRGVDFATGEAALAPSGDGPPVQRKVSDVKDLDALKAPKKPGEMEMATLASDANTPDPKAALPWTATGWDSQRILTKLGQHDRMSETDSDGRRCVQSVALASHILSGPAATATFLANMQSQGLRHGPPSKRASTAMDVLGQVKALIASKEATFGDLSWAQEALHDVSYGDAVGTPEKDVASAVVPDKDGGKLEPMSQWCAAPEDVLALGAKLADKQQYLLCTWSISFNANLDPGKDEQTVGIKDEDGQTSEHDITRIDARKKPLASAFDPHRDGKSGHQMLLYKTGSKLWLYDPELTKTGAHLAEVAKDGAALESSFRDHPALELYSYVEILGKVTPAA